MTLSVQFYTMLVMVLMGTAVGMNLDLYHRFLGKERYFSWRRALLDVLFWVVQALLIFYFLLHANEGEMRIYVFLALLFGFYFYRLWGREVFMSTVEKVITFVKHLLRICKQIITLTVFKPVKFILKVLVSLGMIGITTLCSIAIGIFRVIIFPLRWLASPIVSLFIRWFPPSLRKSINSKVDLLKKWVKEWRIFKRKGG
ncbi:spore cortex biosynthesis protein YabQ [Thalassorhabdus alkalitolerans]|uniref:Spore cortex biosynthesis protein YabQ n=1 Tax=Thalassorhabdus alkalitolerans TaxID=2282697 RepID=A0ABW0YPQ2_9BACI|nr:spore cortex biosynthesis protein YabQ [Thalassobacillus sp. C254]